jgi:hypothetical protein
LEKWGIGRVVIISWLNYFQKAHNYLLNGLLFFIKTVENAIKRKKKLKYSYQGASKNDTRAGLIGGAYMGSTIDYSTADNPEIGAKVTATQYINIKQLQKMEDASMENFGSVGENVGHEIEEAYVGGKDDPGGSYETGFHNSHNKVMKATPNLNELKMILKGGKVFLSTQPPVNGVIDPKKSVDMGEIGNTSTIPAQGLFLTP